MCIYFRVFNKVLFLPSDTPYFPQQNATDTVETEYQLRFGPSLTQLHHRDTQRVF